MKLTVRKSSAAVAAVATAGVSSFFLGAAPANAATETCGEFGTLIEPGVCELVFSGGTAQFTPAAQMTKLEVLLVGAGGSGYNAPVEDTGYAAAGGGGEVKIVDLSGATEVLTVSVPAPGAPGSIDDGVNPPITVENGADGVSNDAADEVADGAYGGASGSGFPGAISLYDPVTNVFPYAAGAGDSAIPASNSDGGAGTVVGAIAVPGSLFVDDARCFGGGGAVAIPSPGEGPPPVIGIPGCGGGGPADATGTTLAAAIANSGGGGGSSGDDVADSLTAGASGVVVFRWNSWTVLPATGATMNAAVLPVGIAAVAAGIAALALLGVRRKREAD